MLTFLLRWQHHGETGHICRLCGKSQSSLNKQVFGSNHVLPCASSRSSSPLLQALLRHCFGPQPQSCPWGERDLQDKSSHPANRRCLMAYCWSCTHLMHRGHDAACKPGGLGKVCKRTCFLLYLVKCNSLVNKQISMLKKNTMGKLLLCVRFWSLGPLLLLSNFPNPGKVHLYASEGPCSAINLRSEKGRIYFVSAWVKPCCCSRNRKRPHSHS